MEVAVQLERSSMPLGISRQKDIGSPMTRWSMPECRNAAATARPYGPAPTIATSVTDMSARHPPNRRTPTSLRTDPSTPGNASCASQHRGCAHGATPTVWSVGRPERMPAPHPAKGVTDHRPCPDVITVDGWGTASSLLGYRRNDADGGVYPTRRLGHAGGHVEDVAVGVGEPDGPDCL